MRASKSGVRSKVWIKPPILSSCQLLMDCELCGRRPSSQTCRWAPSEKKKIREAIVSASAKVKPFGGLLGASWEPLASQDPPGASPEPPQNLLGACEEPPRAPQEPPQSLPSVPGASLEPPRSFLGVSWKPPRCLPGASQEPPGSLPGGSWEPPGAS